MDIRTLLPKDIDKVREIWERDYSKEFTFPDFFDKFIGGFLIEEEGKIILAGGIRSILEMIVVTDKSFDPRTRKIALMRALDASIYMCGKSGYDQLHCFITDKKWSAQVKKYGFNTCIGEALVLNIRG